MNIRYIDRRSGSIEFEHPPAERLMNFLYNSLLGRNTLLPIAKHKVVNYQFGKFMNSSYSKKRIEPFVKSLNIDMSESDKTVDEFVSFNDFFYRKLKDGSRPISSGLICPGDGKLLAFDNISQIQSFYVKGQRFTLSEFLKNDELVKQYNGASMIIVRLAPNDYHRYHFPFGGNPSKSIDMDGTYYSVSPIALTNNFAEVFHENRKSICQLNTKNNGEILIVPVGASMVGTINSTYTPGADVKKGDEMGFFAFGGSSIVLLFDNKNFTIDQDLLTNTRNGLETKVMMGEQIAMDT